MTSLAGAAALAIGCAASAQTSQSTEVVGLAVPVDAGHILSADDLGPVTVPASLAPYVAQPQDIIGKEVKRRLEAGKPVRSYDVMVPQLVRKGQKVALVVKRGAMTLTAQGKALTGGGLGEQVRVQNSQSYSILEGEVVGDGTVQMGAN